MLETWLLPLQGAAVGLLKARVHANKAIALEDVWEALEDVWEAPTSAPNLPQPQLRCFKSSGLSAHKQ